MRVGGGGGEFWWGDGGGVRVVGVRVLGAVWRGDGEYIAGYTRMYIQTASGSQRVS